MAANLNMIKAAAVAVLAVICTVVNITSDVSVSFHNKKPPFCFAIIFHKSKGFIQKAFYF